MQALIRTGKEFGYDAQILTAVEDVNARQKMVLVEKVVRQFGEDLSGKIFAVWGLSFKPGTDDMRQSTAVTVISELTKRGARVQAYDPKAEEEAKTCYLKDNDSVIYCQNKYDALNRADAMLLLTEWKEFRSPDFWEMGKRMHEKRIFDGRNQYNAAMMQRYGFEYEQMGVRRA